MDAALAHRGPDGLTWCGGAVGLGHRMLHTTPESLHETLPLRHPAGHLVLTADARIDNRDELIPALAIRRPFAEITDSDLILAAYEKWGERCPEKLLGDFAFVIWDTHLRHLFCARDHYGVKPFYYVHLPGQLFAFSSEIESLFHLPEVPRKINEIAIADHLMSLYEDKAITPYQGVFRLPSAQNMVVRDAEIRLHTWWSLDPSRELSMPSDGAYAEAFRDLFTETVRCRLRSAFPVGSLLSGGLDSSSVVCTARHILARVGTGWPLQTFSAIFPDLPECDERPFMQHVLALGGLVSHTWPADRSSPLADWDRVLMSSDGLACGPNFFVRRGLCDLAQRQGVRILLTGDDGDTTISHGWATLPEMVRHGQWATLAREVGALSAHLDRPRWRLLWDRAIRPLAPAPLRSIVWWMRASRPLESESPILCPDFVRRLGLVERVRALGAARFRPPQTAREAHLHDLNSGLNQVDLEVCDIMSAAFSVESRHPFHDRRLMAFCLALPNRQKLRGGWTRAILRHGMEGLLPPEIQWRPGKANLGPNVCRSLLQFEGERLEAMLFGRFEVIAPYVDRAALRRKYDRYRTLRAPDAAFHIWKATLLALWLGHS